MEDKEIQTEENAATKKDMDKIVRNHVLGAMGIGLIPVPLADLAALTGLQMNMLRKLAKAYNVPFSKDKGKNMLASLVGAGVPVMSAGSLASFIKTVPVVGQTVGALTMPAISGAMTYAVGKVFIQHFASGGTFLNFDPDEVRAYYAQMFEQGKDFTAGLKQGQGVSKEQASAA
ncbi:MAG: GTPase [Deltaproteobacteria bacterium]|nr:MAG: GTPase [Deltaproteobacteria bacterium]